VATETPKSLSVLTKVLTIALVLNLISTVATSGCEFWQHSLGPMPENADQWSDKQIALSIICLIVYPSYIVTYLVCVVTTCMWMYRAYQNLEAVEVKGLRHTPAAAIYYWFIPIVAIFKPFAVMDDIYAASEHRGSSRVDMSSFKRPAYMMIWWLGFVFGNMCANVTNGKLLQETYPDVVLGISTLSSMLLIASGVCYIRLIGEVTREQEGLFADFATRDKEAI